MIYGEIDENEMTNKFKMFRPYGAASAHFIQCSLQNAMPQEYEHYMRVIFAFFADPFLRLQVSHLTYKVLNDFLEGYLNAKSKSG